MPSLTFETVSERHERRARRRRLILLCAVSFAAGVNAAAWLIVCLLP